MATKASEFFSSLLMLFFCMLPVTNGALDYVSLSASRMLGRHLLNRRAMGLGVIGFHATVDLFVAAVLLAAVALVIPFVIEAFNLVAGPVGGPPLLPVNALIARAATADAPFADRFWVGGMLFSTLVPTAAHLAILATALVSLERFTRWRERTIAILAKPPEPDPDHAAAGELTVAARYLVLRWVPGTGAGVLLIVGLVALYGVIWSLSDQLAWIARTGIAAARVLFG